MPINSGPGIGGRPGGGRSFAPPTTKPATAGTKWVIAEAGAGGLTGGIAGGGGAAAPRGPVTGSCIDILSDPVAWVCAIGGAGAVAFLTQQGGATAGAGVDDASATSQWVYIFTSFGLYLCAIFVAGFAVAAFLWVGSKSKTAMRLGFMVVTAVVATAPIAIGKFRSPQSSQAAPARVTEAAPSTAEPSAAPEPVAEATPPAAEEPKQPVVVEAAPEPAKVIPRLPPQPTGPMLRSELRIEPVRPRTMPRNTAKPAPKPVHPDVKVVQAELRVLRAALRKDGIDLRENLEAEGMKSILAPGSFASRERIRDSRRRLANLRRIVDEYERNVVARLEEFPARVRELDVVEGVKDAALTAFEKEHAESLEKFKEIARLDRAILAEADRLFVFMDSRVGRYRVTDRLLFRDPADAETYTVYVERLQELGGEEKQAVADNQKSVLGRLAHIERGLATLEP